MSERDEGQAKEAMPPQQAQQVQPQAASGAGGELRAPLPLFLGDGKGKPDSRTRRRVPELDEARFAAGVVRFYEAVLREPIPAKMLRLIDELARQEQERER
jgi:hypothetical protein